MIESVDWENHRPGTCRPCADLGISKTSRTVYAVTMSGSTIPTWMCFLDIQERLK